MDLKKFSFYGLVTLILLFGSLGFISGRQPIEMGKSLTDISTVRLNIPSAKINPNPTDHKMLDVKVDIPEGAIENEYLVTAFEFTKQVVLRLDSNNIQFERIGLQVCSGNWKTDFVVDVSLFKDYLNSDISLRSFWVESIIEKTPKLQMINTSGKPDVFIEALEIFFRNSTHGKESDCIFEIKYSKNLTAKLSLENFENWHEDLSGLLICIQSAADYSGAYLGKIVVEIMNDESLDEIFVKFDYKYLDQLAKNKITVDDFLAHVFVSFQ